MEPEITSLDGTWITAHRWFPARGHISDAAIRDDEALFIDDNGRVHVFKYVGMYWREGNGD